jgi:hypothetical protein
MCYPIIFINYEIFAIFPTFCGFALSYLDMFTCIAISVVTPESAASDDQNPMTSHK